MSAVLRSCPPPKRGTLTQRSARLLTVTCWTSRLWPAQRTIRLPVHMIELVNKLIRTSRRLVQELGREPKAQEIAKHMDIPEAKVRKVLKIMQVPISLETPIGEEGDSNLGDFIENRAV